MGATSAIAIVGAGMSMVSSFQQGMAQSQAAKFNANMANQNASLAISSSQAAAKQHQIQAEIAIGSQRANYAASGVSIQGSGLDVLQASAKQAELARQTILYNGKVQANQYKSQAALDRAQGDNAMFAGISGGIAKGLLSYATISSAYGKGNTNSNPLGDKTMQGMGDEFNYTGSYGDYGIDGEIV